MKFTYDWYFSLIDKLTSNHYKIIRYREGLVEKAPGKQLILRHDVDFNLYKAACFAEEEHEHHISSTYFVLVSSDFYNVLSSESRKNIKTILANGHEIGLHYDETIYSGNTDITQNITKESNMLSEICQKEVTLVSMHRPSKATLDANISIPGIINSYNSHFFKTFKYFSDSRMNWRENVDDAAEAGIYNRLQILTHPFWYFDEESSIHNIVKEFINNASVERYISMKSNITNLEEILSEHP